MGLHNFTFSVKNVQNRLVKGLIFSYSNYRDFEVFYTQNLNFTNLFVFYKDYSHGKISRNLRKSCIYF